jgi:DNA-binding NtrC family response regulator
MNKIFISEKTKVWRDVLVAALGKDFDLTLWQEGKDIFELLRGKYFHAVILDMEDSREENYDILRWISSSMPSTPVIMTSNEDRTELVVKAIKQGASDFVVKPFSEARILHAVRQAIDNRCLRNEIEYLRHTQDIVYDFGRIIAFSPVMKSVVNTLKKFAQTDSTILLTGETGTGKSFLSGTIHYNSRRKDKPFIHINCANIPETLLESELFGHEKGAFTGANKLRLGRFEQAHGGTIFLDEIGEISPALQAKLLRVLEDKSFERVGGNRTIHSDVRVIVATNRNLQDQIAAGRFRQDLYYRINVLSLRLPPLRERPQCLEPLAYWLLEKVCISLKKSLDGFTRECLEWMKKYSWPGNIRQLSNMIERAAILEESRLIGLQSMTTVDQEGEVLKPPSEAPRTPALPVKSGLATLEEQEREAILAALEKSLWIQKDAAALLGISPRSLNYKVKKFNITHERWRRHRP